MNTTILEAHNISVRSGKEYLIQGCNFSIYAGEFVTFCQAGIERSPLMEALSGQCGLQSGELVFLGKTVDKHHSLNTFFVPRKSILIDSLSITDNLLALRKTRRGSFLYNASKAQAILTDFLSTQQLPFDIGTPISELREPQKYMLALIKAILFDAPVIVMDDITEHCSIEDLGWIFAFIQRYKKEGRSFVLFSNHDNFLISRSDRVYIIRNNFIADMIFQDEYAPEPFRIMLHGQKIKPFDGRKSSIDQEKCVLSMDFSGILADQLVVKIHKGEVVGLLDRYGSYSDQIYRAFTENFPYVIDGNVCEDYIGAIQNGLGVIPYPIDDLLFDSFSLAENLTFQKLPQMSVASVIHSRVEKYCVQKFFQGSLSPENLRHPYLQQLAMLVYRWLIVPSKVIVLNNPQLDGSNEMRTAFSQIVQEITQAGCALVLISPVPGHYLGLCDKAIVLNQFNDISTV